MTSPKRLGSSYALDESIGSGGMGRVWKGHGPDGQPLAFKLLRDEFAEDHEMVQRFLRERSILTTIRHRNVVAVRDLVAEGSTLAIVMDLVEGSDLRKFVMGAGTLTPAFAAELVSGIASGLAAVHAAGIIHRDIKPANVLIDTTGERPVPKITDFGIAKLVEGVGPATRTSLMLGTPLYMAPEVIDNEDVTSAADIYGLGIVLYELCCGVVPFVGNSPWAIMKAHQTEDPGRPELIPDPVWDLIRQCTAKAPRHRPSARELHDRLEGLLPQLAGIPAAPRLGVPPPPTPSEYAMAGPTVVRSQTPVISPSMTAPAPLRSSPGADRSAGPRRGRLAGGLVVACVAALAMAGSAYALMSSDGGKNPTSGSGQQSAAAPESSDVEPANAEPTSTSDAPAEDVTETESPEPTVMPQLVGEPLSDIDAALPPGTEVETVEVINNDTVDGTVLKQVPAKGESVTDTVTVDVARQPVTHYLDILESVTYDSFVDGTNDVNGQKYPHALTASVEDAETAEYNLGRDYRRFEASVGLSDSVEDSSSTVNFEVYCDGRKLFDETLGFGKAVQVDVDVTDCLRLELKNQHVSGEDWQTPAVWGDARLLGVPSEVPEPTEEP